jgi:tRNA pseudouridine32 synthase/23S rRNA pseudouridine746 synthase
VQKLTLTRTVGAEDPATACEFLAAFTPLSKNRIKDAMARMSTLFQTHQMIKRYKARVRGNPAKSMPGGVIEFDLDGKPATTEFTLEVYEPAIDISTVHIVMGSGRKHQIRRHFDMIGHPVMGDPRYGKGNKNSEGLQLVATGLEFYCPFIQQKRIFETTAEF